MTRPDQIIPNLELQGIRKNEGVQYTKTSCMRQMCRASNLDGKATVCNKTQTISGEGRRELVLNTDTTRTPITETGVKIQKGRVERSWLECSPLIPLTARMASIVQTHMRVSIQN